MANVLGNRKRKKMKRKPVKVAVKIKGSLQQVKTALKKMANPEPDAQLSRPRY